MLKSNYAFVIIVFFLQWLQHLKPIHLLRASARSYYTIAPQHLLRPLELFRLDDLPEVLAYLLQLLLVQARQSRFAAGQLLKEGRLLGLWNESPSEPEPLAGDLPSAPELADFLRLLQLLLLIGEDLLEPGLERVVADLAQALWREFTNSENLLWLRGGREGWASLDAVLLARRAHLHDRNGVALFRGRPLRGAAAALLNNRGVA